MYVLYSWRGCHIALISYLNWINWICHDWFMFEARGVWKTVPRDWRLSPQKVKYSDHRLFHACQTEVQKYINTNIQKYKNSFIFITVCWFDFVLVLFLCIFSFIFLWTSPTYAAWHLPKSTQLSSHATQIYVTYKYIYISRSLYIYRHIQGSCKLRAVPIKLWFVSLGWQYEDSSIPFAPPTRQRLRQAVRIVGKWGINKNDDMRNQMRNAKFVSKIFIYTINK